MCRAKWGHGNVWMLKNGDEFAAMNADFFAINAVTENIFDQLDFACGKGSIMWDGKHGLGFR